MRTDRIPIGRFSLMTHLTPKALRSYDKKGLLVPEVKDAFTGYRCYASTQIEKGVKIRTLSWMGFNLDDIGLLLDAEERGDRELIGRMMKERYEETGQEMDRLARVRDILLRQTDTLELFGMSVSEPIIKQIPEIRVISKREKGTYEVTIGKLIGELFEFVERSNSPRNNIRITGPCMFICHDEEYRETDADIETVLPVAGNVCIEDQSVDLITLPAIRAVSAIHRGPYQEVGVAYTRLFEYMNEHGLELAGPSRALYLNDPEEVAEEELMSEIQLPVK